MAFNLSTASITKQRPIDTIEWTRPGDWISITSVPDNEIYYLVADMALKTFRINTTFTRTASQNIYIDWGDGTTTTISTTTSTGSQKTYTTGGTPCSRGYNTYRIRIYGDAGTTITGAAFAQPTTYNRSNYPVYLLEAWYGNGVNIPMAGYFTSNGFNYQTLEYVKLPTTYLGTSFNSTFYGSLVEKVDMPTSAPNLTDIGFMFFQCYNIQTITFPSDATGISGFGSTFLNCSSLINVTLPTTLNSVTSASSMFNGCRSLKSINMPTMPNCLDFTQTFAICSSLTFVELKPFPTTGAISLSNTFNGCSSLENVKLPPITGTATLSTMAGTFTSCSNLKQFKFPAGYNPTSMNGTFSACASLQKVEMLSSMPALTTFTSTFSNCTNLTEVNLPTTVTSGGIGVFSAFVNCPSISKITIPSSWNLSGSANTICQNCYDLVEFNFPANAQDSITTLVSAFSGCNRLKTITMPTSMNSATSLATMFNGCQALETVTLPSTLNAVTTMASAFANCLSLRAVTLPTSMSALTAYNSIFIGCQSLKSVTMPATVAATLTTGANAFQNCYNLETVTLPTTQTTSLTSVGSMFAGCYSLKTINNTTNLGQNTLSATAVLDANGFAQTAEEVTSTLTFSCKLSKLGVNGSATNISKLTNLRLTLAGTITGTAQWGGTSFHIDISYTAMSTAAINQLFADMAAQGNVTSKTINITGATGAAGLTAADRLVITSKGWTITG